MPQFTNITGHKNQINGLKNAITLQRVFHAYLFFGPDGTGKTITAKAFAAALLCDSPQAGDSCGCCKSCRQVINSNHPDLFQIAPQGASIKIEQIRDIQKKTKYKPYQNKYQIFIIDAAQTMTIEAANCFLKILEEPPEKTVFILITPKPDLLPTTVVSRCQHLAFKELTFEETVLGLVSIAGISEEEARLPALTARGSIGKALNYIADTSEENLRDRVINLSNFLTKGLTLELLDEVLVLAENKNKALEVIELLLMWYRDLLVWKKSNNKSLLFNKDKSDIVLETVKNYTTEALIAALEQLEKTRYNLMLNGNPRLVMDVLLIGLTGFKEGSSEYVP